MNPIVSKVGCIFIVINFLLFNFTSAHQYLPCPPKTATSPPPSSPNKPNTQCSKDILKFGVCGSWLGLVSEEIGTKPSDKCCTLVKGLADLEAALCLCTAIKANVLGMVKLKVPVAVTLLVNACEKKVPDGFVCA